MQGGAIRVFDGATLKITTCTFQQNSVEFVSEGFEVVLKLFPHKRRIVLQLGVLNSILLGSC